jgi:hypothetical protein
MAAAEEGTPRLEGEIAIEIESDSFIESDDPDSEFNDTYTTIEPYLALHLLPGFSIETGLVFEPVQDPDPGTSRFFDDQGLYVEQLFAKYEMDAFAVYGGKYNPPFGTAWDLAPGIYGADFAEDYELTEAIGLGGALIFGGEGLGGAALSGSGLGVHRLSLNGFFSDTTPLSESVITERGRARKSDGGVGNTEDLSSATATLDGGEFGFAPWLNYHLGFERRAAGEGDAHDEDGFVAGLSSSFELMPDLSLEPLVEVAHLRHAEGADQDRTYITLGAALVSGPWNFALSATNRETDTDDPDLTDSSDQLFQASVGYAFDFGLGIDAGYRYAREAGIDTHGVGVLLSYSIEFAVP